jgi:hypothetical protein
MVKNKKFSTLRLWKFIDFELKYLENRWFSTNETFFFIEFFTLENPCMQNVRVVWEVHITAEKLKLASYYSAFQLQLFAIQ